MKNFSVFRYWFCSLHHKLTHQHGTNIRAWFIFTQNEFRSLTTLSAISN